MANKKLEAPEGLVQHGLYTNEVIEDMLEELLTTRLNAMNLMTIDRDLAENEGMIKKVLVYKYEGNVEELSRGEGNADSGVVSHAHTSHEVKVAQHMFQYADEDLMIDSKVLEYGLQGAAKVMANHMTAKYFDALKTAELLSEEAKTLSYDVVVDALAKMETNPAIAGAEQEVNAEGAFLLINPKHRATLRKDPEFKAAAQGELLFSGQIGQICGLPVVVSAAVPADQAYVATKEAVTCFIKKESQVEQDRDINRRMNTIVMRKVNVVALTDATKAVRINLK